MTVIHILTIYALHHLMIPLVHIIYSNLYMHGKPFSQCPRQALIRQLKRANEMGYKLKTGAELEFILMNKEGTDIADPHDRQFLSYQEPASLMRRSDFLMEVTDCMDKLGWEPYQVKYVNVEHSLC